MAISNNRFSKIVALRQRYYNQSKGKQSLLDIISEIEVSEQVYNSNAIENSTLTLEETEKILLQIDLDRFISERELFEAKNLARVVEYINKRAREQLLTEDVILLVHKMLLSNIRDDVAGRFRKANEFVRVGNHIAVNPEKIQPEIEEMLIEYNTSIDKNIVERIAKLHLRFEYIHPFVDGNGRIGRAINNYLLIQEGYVPINIKFLDRKNYYEALQEFDLYQKTEKMEAIVFKAIVNSYFKRLAYLEHKNIITLNEYSKTNKTSHSNLLNKANRQTIEAFVDKGIWKIGIEH